MQKPITCRHTSHANIVIADLAASVHHLEEVFGGSHMLDLPDENWHACLIEVGGFIIELFEPRHFMLHSRIGPHHLGIEFEANVDEARAVCAAQGVRIMRDIVMAIHTDPADGFGVDFEFFDGTFYGSDAKHVTTKTKPAAYWAAHPIGYAGLVGYTHAVADLEAASTFLQDFIGARPVYDTVRDSLGARAIGLQIADAQCELVSPTGPGPLLNEMMRSGEGMRSTVFAVRDVAAARSWFEARGLRVIEGTMPGAIAVDPRDNLGILFEFVEKAGQH